MHLKFVFIIISIFFCNISLSVKAQIEDIASNGIALSDIINNNNERIIILSNRIINFDYKLVKRELNENKKNKAYIELLLVCDYYCFNRHKQLLNTLDTTLVAKHVQAYLSSIINLTNVSYKNSFQNDNQLNIELYIKNILILTHFNSSLFTTSSKHSILIKNKLNDSLNRRYVNSDSIMPEFNRWLINQFSDNLSFDIAVAFTYANLYTTSRNDILGFSIIGGACRLGTNGILIEENGAFSSVKTLAHELAHSIGIEKFLFFYL